MRNFQVFIALFAAFSSLMLLECSAAAEPAAALPRESLSQQLEKAGAAEMRGDLKIARDIYLNATNEKPDAAEAWAAWGEHLRFYAHDEKAAALAFTKALESKQQNATAAAFAWRGLGELAAKEQKDDAAIGYFKKSIEALPLADTHRSLCHLYCRQRKFTEAAEHARLAVQLNTDDPIARLLYAAQLHRAGEKQEGRREYEKALARGGLDPEGKADGPVHCCVYYNAAGYLSVYEDSEAALKMLRRFFETPNHRHLSRNEIETDADFEKLKALPAFSKLLDEYFPESSAQK